MKLKEKWTKQNNSIRLLLRKLKRHDTVVVAIAVVIAVALCGGLIYISTPVVTEAAREGLEETENANAEKTVEKLEELQEYLKGLDEMITENQESISEYYNLTKNNKAQSEADKEKTAGAIGGVVGEKVSVLNNDMKTLKETVNNTQTNVEKLREIVEKGGSDNSKQITDGFTNIYKELSDIEKKYADTQTNTQNLIKELSAAMNKENSELSADMKKQYQDLLDKLSTSNQQMSQQSTEMLAGFKNDLTSLSTDMNNKFNSIDAKVTQVNTDMTNNFNMLSGSVEGDFDEMKAYFDAQMTGVNENLLKVFRSVSDGKKLLASALLTKGVKIDTDATFDDIYKAILSIPTTYKLDTGDTTGNIEYVHHYHCDGAGTVCNEAFVTPDKKGGCYNKEVYHKHTDACYKTTTYYQFRTVKDVVQGEFKGDNWEGKAQYVYHCNSCGFTWTGTNGWHAESAATMAQVRARDGDYVKPAKKKTLICKVTPGTLEGYATDCGMAHGQIVAARIVFAPGYENYNTQVDPITGDFQIDSSLTAVPAEDTEISLEELFEELMPLEEPEWYPQEDPAPSEPKDNNKGDSQSTSGSDTSGTTDDTSAKEPEATAEVSGQATEETSQPEEPSPEAEAPTPESEESQDQADSEVPDN